MYYLVKSVNYLKKLKVELYLEDNFILNFFVNRLRLPFSMKCCTRINTILRYDSRLAMDAMESSGSANQAPWSETFIENQIDKCIFIEI